jgi:hypothetical protein
MSAVIECGDLLECPLSFRRRLNQSAGRSDAAEHLIE